MGVASKLNKTVLIFRKSVAGGYPPTPSWSLLSTKIKGGLLIQLSARERIARDGKHLNVDVKLIMLPTDITENDRVYIDESYYEVAGRPKDPNEKGRHLEIDLKLLPEGSMP